jgi:hypothetical protein
VTVDRDLRFRISVGFMLTVLTSIVGATIYITRADERATAVEVRVTRTEDRQNLYIERDATAHALMEVRNEELHHALEAIREAWAAEHGEVLPR